MLQGLPRDELHHHRWATIVREELSDDREARVVQSLQQLSLTLEELACLDELLATQFALGSHLFKCPDCPITRTVNPIDRAHAAAANQVQNGIPIGSAAYKDARRKEILAHHQSSASTLKRVSSHL